MLPLGSVPTENLSLELYEEILIQAIKERPGLGRNSARSAVRHINSSWKTREVDVDMAVLRMFTAEEEAATSIFYSLKRLKYPLSEKINMKSHLHKLALSPFLRIMGSFFQKNQTMEIFDPELKFCEDPRRIFVSCSAEIFGHPGRFEPIPPLHFDLSVNEETYHFSDEIEEFCKDKNIKKMEDFMKETASTRHKLLYGTDEGIASVTVGKDFFDMKRKWVFMLLSLYIMIDEHKEHQLFVCQALAAFCKMINYIKPDVVEL